MKIFNIEIQGNLYSVKIIKRRNSKRITLRVNLKTKQPTISIPFSVSYFEAIDFLKSNHLWIENQLAKTSSIKQLYFFANLSAISIYGESYRIIKRTAKKNKITINMKEREIYLDFKDLAEESLIEKTFIKFLKKISAVYFHQLSLTKAQKINTNFSGLNVSDTTSKWGSCSAKKKLQYNYRLIMAPIFVIDYVISHEVAHLIEFNHSANFWNILNKLTPYRNEAGIWLKNYGKSLY
ncbi:MAG: M48 family metallopeptidase [Alphaproteobacteria bacterium]|nr:M48 family metallopeptidase [Alphaproteobacteria bacterium]